MQRNRFSVEGVFYRGLFNSLALLLPMAPIHAQTTQRVDREEVNKKLVQHYMTLIEDSEFTGWTRYFADSVTFNGTRIPPQAISGILTQLRRGFPDLHFTIAGQVAEEDRVVTWGFFEGTHSGEFAGIAPTNQAVKWLGIAIDRIEDGKVVELWHEMDMWGVVQQLRAAEPEG